jgi:haloalkane dehalogenase
MPDRVGGLVMGNTWFWPADTFMMNSFSRLMGSRPLQALITKRNFFVSPMMKRFLKGEATDSEFEHYLAVVPTPQSRRGIAEFPKQIRDAKPG